MGIELVPVVAVCAVLFVAAMRAYGRTAQSIGGMFRAPELGWPAGVQEDDDLHWSWTAPGTGEARLQAADEAELQELDPAALRLPAQRLVHHRRG